MQNEEVKFMLSLVYELAQKGFRNLESVNVGSAHKTKDEIVNTVSTKARKARRLNDILSKCLEDLILNGSTIDEFYERKLSEATRKNQCKADSDESLEELAMFTELVLNFKR